MTDVINNELLKSPDDNNAVTQLNVSLKQLTILAQSYNLFGQTSPPGRVGTVHRATLQFSPDDPNRLNFGEAGYSARYSQYGSANIINGEYQVDTGVFVITLIRESRNKRSFPMTGDIERPHHRITQVAEGNLVTGITHLRTEICTGKNFDASQAEVTEFQSGDKNHETPAKLKEHAELLANRIGLLVNNWENDG